MALINLTHKNKIKINAVPDSVSTVFFFAPIPLRQGILSNQVNVLHHVALFFVRYRFCSPYERVERKVVMRPFLITAV